MSLYAPEFFSDVAQDVARKFLTNFGGWTLFVASLSVVFCFGMALGPWGRRVIGGPDAVPEFRMATWIGMMFAAGMGAGLVFWGAAEPLFHYLMPPPGEGLEAASPAARSRSLAITQFHWAFHGWGIYGATAIAIGLAATARGAILPSAPFTKLPAPARQMIDAVALVSVLFGVVASTASAVQSVGAGTEILTAGGLLDGVGVQLAALILLSLGYLSSAALGLRRGIAVLSNVNMVLAVLLAAYVLIAGPTVAIVATLFESIASYAKDLPELSLNLRSDEAGRQWTSDWSLTYFLWWAAWTPFVGVFLVRISRGRTIRSFVGGAVFIPTLVTLVWFAIFGGTALELDRSGVDLAVTSFDTAPQATYRLLGELPLSALFQVLTILLMAVFLITSADSGAYVLAMFSEGRSDPGLRSRLFWGVVIGVLAAASVLSAQGQALFRAVAVSGAIPLTVLLFAWMANAVWQLIQEHRATKKA